MACGLDVSSARTLERMLVPLHYIAVRRATKQIVLARGYSIAFDFWTSLSPNHYLALTYHYSNEELDSFAVLLNLVPFYGNASGRLTAQVIRECTAQLFLQ